MPSTTPTKLDRQAHLAIAGTIGVQEAVCNPGFHAELLNTAMEAATLLRDFVAGAAAAKPDRIDDSVRGFVAHLEELSSKLGEALRLARQGGFDRKMPYAPVFQTIETHADRLDDVLESYRLALSDEFRQFVEEAVQGIKPSSGRKPDWRSSLGTLRD